MGLIEQMKGIVTEIQDCATQAEACKNEITRLLGDNARLRSQQRCWHNDRTLLENGNDIRQSKINQLQAENQVLMTRLAHLGIN